jgi:methionyl-tRNA synthetase
MARFYVTTAIDYVNASPHIGHAYEKILADALARYHRLRGWDVFFLTGTDEHGQKNVTSAQAAGRPVREFVEENAAKFRALEGQLHLSIDDFIRTTEPRHAAGVAEIWRRVAAAGDLYKKNYRALYCVGHEAFVTLSDLVDGKCPDHGTEPVVVEEENYFFRLSKHRAARRRLFESRHDFVVPQTRYAEMLNLIDGLEDISVSRPADKLRGWGIPVPGDPSHLVYVWFDALTNYISAVGFGRDEEAFRRWWPAHHVIGKDINRFHSLLWPAMLISAGLEPPRRVIVHGFLTVEGQKISKSLGNVIDPVEVARELAARSGGAHDVCVDAVRYFLLRDVPFGEDGDFSRAALVARFNADLANDYGNLLNRTLPLVARDFGGRLPARGPEERGDAALRTLGEATAAAVLAQVDRLNFSGALAEVWRLLGAANKYLDEEAPWTAIRRSRERAGTVLYNTLEALRIATILLAPVLPLAAARVWEQLGASAPLGGQRLADAERWGGLPAGREVRPGAPVFPRVDTRVPAAGAAAAPETKEDTPVDQITIDEFRRADLRIAEVKAAERVAGTDKLVKLTVDVGDDVRTLVAGIATHYRPDDLVGRRIVVVANLQPRKVRGVESRGMLLAATWGDDVAILTVDGAAPIGARIT